MRFRTNHSAGMAAKLSVALLLLAMATNPFFLQAQNESESSITLSLSLEEALKRAEEFHPQLQTAKADVEIRQAEKQQSMAVILPQVNFSMTASVTNDPLNVFGTRLLQERVEQADFNPASLNAPDPISNWQAKFELMQPIFQPEGLFKRKAIHAAEEAQQLVYARTKEGIELEVTQRYLYWVLALEANEVIAEALAAAEKNYKDANALYEEGIIDKADLLSAQLFVEQLQLKLTHQQAMAAGAADQLKQRLGIEADTEITPTDRTIDLADASSSTAAIASRADIQALSLALEAENALYKGTKSRVLPSIGAFGSYQWNDEDMFFGQGENFMVGVQAKVPLFTGGINAGAAQKQKLKVRKARIQLNEQTAAAENEYRESVRMLNLAKRQLEVSELGQQQAEEAYRIKKDRHEEGLVRTFELIQAQTTLLEQKLNYLKAGFDVQLATKKRDFAAQ